MPPESDDEEWQAHQVKAHRKMAEFLEKQADLRIRIAKSFGDAFGQFKLGHREGVEAEREDKADREHGK